MLFVSKHLLLSHCLGKYLIVAWYCGSWALYISLVVDNRSDGVAERGTFALAADLVAV